jgi:RNA polymerase sigma factor (sigma-70 family)
MAPAADIRELLAHAEWLRRLATRLVGDGDAADVVQQTWLAALRSPPAGDRPARPWLAEVLRNFARRSYRDRQTRHRYEAGGEATGVVGGSATAESLLEAAELQRLLAELVAALDEPYRSTILLRFYQGIEPTEIARTTGVPAGTVRWRVNEGVRRLRAALDSREGVGDWRRALLPLASAGPPAASALNGGLLIMTTKAKLGIAAVAVAALAVGALTWNVRADRTGTTVGTGTGAASAQDPSSLATRPEDQAVGTSGIGAPAAIVGQQPATIVRPRSTRQPPPRLLSAPAGSVPAPSAAPEQRRGTLDKEEIRRAMRQTIPALKQCYARLLEHQPQATGRLVFRFTITEDGAGGGRISDASVLPQAADAGAPELIAPLTEQCMLNALTEAPFPSPQGRPVTVTYPFSFAPSGDMIPGTARPPPAP